MSEDTGTKAGYILFYGALWGVLEATLGWALKFLPGFVSGSVMFPLALGIMLLAWRKMGDRRSIFIIAVIASLIKLVDLILPGLPPVRTINPAIAILLEGAVVALLIPVIQKSGLANRVLGAAGMNFLWRTGFLVYVSVLQLAFGVPVGILRSFASAMSFLLLYGGLGTILSVLVIQLEAWNPDRRPELTAPIRIAIPLFAIALGLQVIL